MKKREETIHWSKRKELAAGYWHVKLLLIIFNVFPVIILRVLAFPVGFFYFLFSKKARNESKRFLQKAAPFTAPEFQKKCKSRLGPMRHIISFSLSLVEKIETWGGKYQFKNIHFQDDDIGDLIRNLENGKGVFLITSHLGNAELLRGLLSFDRTGVSHKIPIIAVIETKITAHFNRMMKELNPQSTMDLINSSEIGPQTAILFEEKLSAGGIVTIAADRNSSIETEKNFLIPFLGEDALFSPGAFQMAALMNAPVYLIFGLRQKTFSLRPRYNMHVHRSALDFDCPRKERQKRSMELARSYVNLLEGYCKENPFQWYNFYDFWAKRYTNGNTGEQRTL